MPASDAPDAPDARDAEPAAADTCLRLLAGRPRTRAELAAALQRRSVPPQIAEVVLDRLTRAGYVDDAAFAAAWVDSRQPGRGLARRALADELRRRGVPADLSDSALERIDPAAEVAAARALVARRLPRMTGLPASTRIRRLTGVLVRRGYPAGLAARIVREAESDATGEATDPSQ